jgi:hypothetical protein
MWSLFRAPKTRVEVIDTDTPTTQHGTAFVRDASGKLLKLGLSFDRPEVLADASDETIMDVFEQLGRQGYIPQSLEIATLGTHSSHDAPHAARVLEKLQFDV